MTKIELIRALKSRKDALDVAIARLENGDSRVIQDSWTLMEVEDD